MKKFLKTKYQVILKNLAGNYIKKNKPDIIAITGSVGKTSTKEAIYKVLSSKFSVVKNTGNYNNEIGVPLTVLGLKVGSFPFGWIKNTFFGYLKPILDKKRFEKIILEMGADHPGDIRYLTSFIKPRIAVITKVACSHLEFFCSLNNIAQEKGALVEPIDQNGWAVLNYDDELVREMNERCRGKTFYFGLNKKADIYADEIISNIHGLDFVIHYKETSKNVHLNIIGRHLIYSVLAGIACGLIYGMSLDECMKALEDFKTEKGRVNLVKGINGSIIIDDTYNANPESTSVALDLLGEMDSQRKIVVLGDMLELGEDSVEKHKDIILKALDGKYVKMVLVGEKMREAVSNLSKDEQENILIFPNSIEAGETLKNILKNGDVVLVKGSQGMRMEKAVELAMEEPLRAENLLCRQSKVWKKK